MKTWPLLLTLTLLVWCVGVSEADDDMKGGGGGGEGPGFKENLKAMWTKLKATGSKVLEKVKNFGKELMNTISKKTSQLLDSGNNQGGQQAQQQQQGMAKREAGSSFASERRR